MRKSLILIGSIILGLSFQSLGVSLGVLLLGAALCPKENPEEKKDDSKSAELKMES